VNSILLNWPPDCISIGGCREAGQSDGSTQITQVDFLVDEADRFGRAGEAQADALIIDLEDAVAFTDKQKARAAALQYLEQPPGGRFLPTPFSQQ